MKSLQQRIDQAKVAIIMLRLAIESGCNEPIIDAMNLLERDSLFTWDDISDSLFEEWDELTDAAQNILYS